MGRICRLVTVLIIGLFLTSCDFVRNFDCPEDFSINDTYKTCTYETDGFVVSEIEGVQDIEDIEHKPVINNDGTTYIFDYSLEDTNNLETKEINIYRTKNNIASIEKTITLDFNFSLLDVKISGDGHFIVLGYVVPENADSDTYCPIFILEIPLDLSKYTLHELDNEGMRIPRRFEINEKGQIGIIGESMPTPSEIHSGYASIFMIFDADYNQIVNYRLGEPGDSFYYNRIETMDNSFILTGILMTRKDDYNNYYSQVIHIFNDTGLVRSDKRENVDDRPILINVIDIKSFGIISKDDTNKVTYRLYDDLLNLLEEKSIQFESYKNFSEIVITNNQDIILTYTTYSKELDKNIPEFYYIEQSFTKSSIQSYKLPIIYNTFFFPKHYLYYYNELYVASLYKISFE